MKLPRDLSPDELTKSLHKFGYSLTRQSGSHLRLTTFVNGKHNITLPKHKPIRIGTLASIIADVAKHFEFSKEELVNKLFGSH